MGVPPTPEQAERLLAVARTRHRTALGLVVAGDVPGASWTWELTAEGRLKAGVLGFDVAAQLLPPAQYAAVVSLFRDSDGDAPLTPPAVGEAPAAHLRPGAPVAVEVGLLGPASSARRARSSLTGSRWRPSSSRTWRRTRRRAPERAGRGAVAARRDDRGAGRGIGPGAPVAGHGPAPARPTWSPTRTGGCGSGPDVGVDWQVFRGLVARAGQAADAAAVCRATSSRR